MKTSVRSRIKSELEKVNWPSSNTVVRGSLIIILVSAFFVGFVSILDLSFSNLINLIKR